MRPVSTSYIVPGQGKMEQADGNTPKSTCHGIIYLLRDLLQYKPSPGRGIVYMNVIRSRTGITRSNWARLCKVLGFPGIASCVSGRFCDNEYRSKSQIRNRGVTSHIVDLQYIRLSRYFHPQAQYLPMCVQGLKFSPQNLGLPVALQPVSLPVCVSP